MLPDDVALSDVLKDPKEETVMEMHGVEAHYTTLKSLMYAIQTEDKEA